VIKQFIEDSQARAYLRDLCAKVEKIVNAGDWQNRPLLVIGVGGSGNQIATTFLEEMLVRLPNKIMLYACIDRTAGSVDPAVNIIPSSSGDAPHVLDGQLPNLSSGGDVLLMDDVERTGETMRLAHEAICKNYSLADGTIRVWSYSIALSTNSSFVPAWYGFVYPPNVYVYKADENNTVPNFVLDHQTRDAQTARPFLLRKPKHGDPNFEIKIPASMGRYHAADRYFDHETRSKTVLILEHNSKPVGYLSFHVDGKNLWVSSIAVCDLEREDLPGAGHAMFSYAENAAIALTCKKILLWAISSKVSSYEKWGCHKVDDITVTVPAPPPDPAEQYVLMAFRVDLQRRFSNY
jgi:hypoxanthine phosphoribosyltransferase